MVAPVTGPYVTAYTSTPRIGIHYERHKYKQARPHNLALPYFSQRLATVSRWVKPQYDDGSTPPYTYPGNWNPRTRFAMSPDWYSGLDTQQQKLLDQVTNDARAKFVSRLGSSAALGVSLAERKQAMSMIASRATQLYTFTRRLRKGDFSGAAKALGWNVTSTSKKTKVALLHLSKRGVPGPETARVRRGSKAFASNYLEFHFGWSPLIADIFAATEVLSEPISSTMVFGAARRDGVRFVYNDDVYYGLVRANKEHTVNVLVRVQAEVSVSNPNLRLASQLGLVNPATLAWELVPFSFVLDWFVNVSDYLEQFTDLAGLDVVNPFYTYKWESKCQAREYNTRNFWAFGENHVAGDRLRCDSYAFSTRRQLGIPSVKLAVRSPWTLSPRRALAAVSLLLQKGLQAPKR